MRLLYVEDEPDILESTKKLLEADGHVVDTCLRGDDALAYIELTDYDLIILDIMLPGLSGLEVLEQMRTNNNTTPVILLTARDCIADRVQGLDAGSDDYLTKPFAYEELSARIRALARRPQQEEVISNELSIADLTMDLAKHEVRRAGDLIDLSSKEFTILELFLRNQDQVLSRAQIEQSAWSYDFEGSSNVVDVYIRFLRNKIDKNYSPKLIHTVRGVGYILKVEEES